MNGQIGMAGWVVLALAVFDFTGVCARASELVGLDQDTGNIYDIARSNAQPTLVGSTGLVRNSTSGGGGCLALGPDNNLYAITTGASPETPELFKINPSTFASNLVGPLGLSFVFEGALAIAPDGTAYATNAGTSSAAELFTVNLNSGAATIVGTLSGGSHDINGMVWRSDSTLVGIDRVTNSLVDINPVTASLSVIAALSPVLGSLGDMTEVDGQAYFSTAGPGAPTPGSNELWTVNLFTGAESLVGNFGPTIQDDGISGLAPDPFLPEPGSAAILAIGGVAALLPGTRQRGRKQSGVRRFVEQ